MKTTRKILFAVCFLLLTVCVGTSQTSYKDLKYPPLHDVKLPNIQRFVLDNGIIVYLVEDHDLPLIAARARIGAGSIDEPAEKIGLADMTGSVMRTGGTPTHPGDSIDELLESMGARVETSIGLLSGFASMSVLKENVDTGLDVLADLLMNPAFPQNKIDLEKVQAKSSISRRNDDAGEIANREFEKLIYGANSVYARVPEYATIDAVTREDMVAFHKRYFVPNNVMIGVWGDFNTKEMLKKIDSTFKNWKKGDFKRPQPPPVDYKFDSSVNLIRKDDVNQSNILIGHIGGLQNNPDYFALEVMNNVLSGGFGSRLFSRVRSVQGLAYSVFGEYSANYNYPGEFYAGAQTKSESTVKATRAVLKELELIRKEEVTDDELARAKDTYLNSYVFNFEDPGQVLNRLMTYEYYGYPKDFLEKEKENIEKVTKADVLRVAQKYVHPDQVRILVLGRDKDFDEPLSTLGKVNEIDITIPSDTPATPGKAPQASEDSLSKGKDVFNKGMAALGGKAAFSDVKSLHVKGTSQANMGQGNVGFDVEATIVMPDRIRIGLTSAMGAMAQVLKADEGWIITPAGNQPAPQQFKDEMKANLWRDLTYLYANADTKGLQVQSLGLEDVNGKKAEALQITPPAAKPFKLYLDSETYMPVKESFDSITAQGPAHMDKYFSDFRDVSGLKLPYKSWAESNGQKAQETTFTEITVNAPVDEAQFEVKK